MPDVPKSEPANQVEPAYADLAADTHPVRTGEGTYRVELPDSWNFRYPSGGALMTAALRAAQTEIAEPELRLRSASTIFSSPIEVGPLDVAVRIIRKGGVAAQAHVSLCNAGAPDGLELLATFARSRNEGPLFVDAKRPDVPPPHETAAIKRPTPVRKRWVPKIFRQMEARLAEGHQWEGEAWAPREARIVRWVRHRVPQVLADGTYDPLSLPPIMDAMPPSTIQKLGPGFTPFVAPSLDLTVHFLQPVTSDWVLTDTHTRYAGDGYGSADVHVWDLAGGLVGYATQMWIFRKVPDKIG
jgi:acyl-CoA thioesterase